MAKNAIQKIEEHEKLCRIMQKQTHDKIHKLENQINVKPEFWLWTHKRWKRKR